MTENKSFEFIRNTIANNKVVLFMKGTKEMPQCGFSSTVAVILEKLEVPFCGVNVLANEELREAIKDFSDWPTIPQLYIDGEFIGGCDIVREMYQSGALTKLLERN